MRLALLALTLCGTVAAQDAHVPTITVTGRIVEVDANIAWVSVTPAGGEVRLVTGVELVGDVTLAANNDTAERVRWELSPGVWEITALGHPDDPANPDRQQQVFPVTIASPTRTDDIRDAVLQLLTAQLQLDQLNATRAEIITAILGLR